MNKQSLHQIVQIIIAILTALATSLTAQSCMKKKLTPIEPRITAAVSMTEGLLLQHASDVQLLLTDGKDTTRVASICLH